MADIVVANAKKVNFLDRIIQSVVIAVNLNKMNRAIEEHIDKFREVSEDAEKRENLEKVLREVVYLKYQYEIIQRNMYELKLVYTDDLIEKINTVEKMERLNVQKTLFEMEYERISKSKFHTKESIKYRLLTVSTVLGKIKQEIKDEGKLERYTAIIRAGEEIDSKVASRDYTDEMYNDLIEKVNEYTKYINENYDIAKLPADERELIELVFEATMNDKLNSEIDRLNYEFNLLVSICKNSYIYCAAIDKVFAKILALYDDMYATTILDSKDYLDFFRELFDIRIKTKVNDVKRSQKLEDEYLEYCKVLMEPEELEEYLIQKAIDITENTKVKKALNEIIEEKNAEKLAAEEEAKAEEEEEKAEEEKIDSNVSEIKEITEEDLDVDKIAEEKPIKVRRRGGAAKKLETEVKEEIKEVKEAIKEENETEIVETDTKKIRARKGLGSFGRRKVESI